MEAIHIYSWKLFRYSIVYSEKMSDKYMHGILQCRVINSWWYETPFNIVINKKYLEISCFYSTSSAPSCHGTTTAIWVWLSCIHPRTSQSCARYVIFCTSYITSTSLLALSLLAHYHFITSHYCLFDLIFWHMCWQIITRKVISDALLCLNTSDHCYLRFY